MKVLAQWVDYYKKDLIINKSIQGDNGSPLIEYVSHSYWLVGIASFISGNGCESTDPSGYTRTFPYTTWIKSVIA